MVRIQHGPHRQVERQVDRAAGAYAELDKLELVLLTECAEHKLTSEKALESQLVRWMSRILLLEGNGRHV